MKPLETNPVVGPGLPPGYLTKKQVAQYLNVSVRTVDSLMKSKRIGYLKITRKLVRFRKSDVDDYLARNFRIKAFAE